MNAKEKAKELFDKMEFHCHFNCQPSLTNMIAIECAIIACDEHINQVNSYSSECIDEFNLKMEIDFYNEVKIELRKIIL